MFALGNIGSITTAGEAIRSLAVTANGTKEIRGATHLSDDPYANRRHLTFEQAEGAEPLPRQLLIKEISPELRAQLWAFVHTSIEKDMVRDYGSHIVGEWGHILKSFHINHQHLPIDTFDNSPRILLPKLKQIVYSDKYVTVFGFLQFVLRHRGKPHSFEATLDAILSQARAAYRVLDGQTIVPIGSDEERKTLDYAFATLSRSEFHGARSHLHDAGAKLTAGDYPGSVRESIHAVESTARSLASSGKLSEALAHLEKSAAIHGGLKKGFLSIYGYTSDEQGIRHPLIDDPAAKVDETDALFMIGACASFVSYLINKARSAGLLKTTK
jgi:hypothetical protein